MQSSDDCYFHYLPAYDHISLRPVNVMGAGRFVAHGGEQYPPNGHPTLYQFDWRRGRRLPEFQVLLLTGGGGEFESEATGLVRFEGPALIVLFPGIWHRYRPLRDCDWMERWLSFSGEIAYSVFDLRVSAARFALTSLADAGRLVESFDEMLSTIHGTDSIDAELLALKALKIIIESAQLRQQAISDQITLQETHVVSTRMRDPVVRRALEIIWSHEDNSSMSVREIARRMCIARRTLDGRFASIMGYTVLAEIHNCRMSRAKRLLMATDLPIKQIAYLAGYPNGERMRVAFQKREEMTPLEFRRKFHGANERAIKRCRSDRKWCRASNP